MSTDYNNWGYGMTIEQIINKYVTWANAMRKLGMSQNAYQGWLKRGCIPYHTQKRIQKASGGYFQADTEILNNYEVAAKNRHKKNTK